MPSPSSSPSGETYTLEDLRTWRQDRVSLAVLGHPVRHSISPQMHNAALAQLASVDNRFERWRYYRFDVPPEKLVESLPLFHAAGFFGLNLTVPHKEIALAAVAEIDPHAKRIGAVNTLVRRDEGYKGHNTDGYGLSQAVRRELGRQFEAADIVLLGAGGAARAAALQCLLENCRSLRIVNRNQERLNRLLDELSPEAERRAVQLTGSSPDAFTFDVDSPIVINATSLGLKPDDPLPISTATLPAKAALYDMIYNPAETKLMRAFVDAGAAAANGLSMLVGQGAKALEIWSGYSVPEAAMTKAARGALGL